MDDFFTHVPRLTEQWQAYRHMFRERRVCPRTMLLKQGSVALSIFFIKKGCLRMGYREDSGKDITFQFFFENDRVASIESFMSGEPSECYIEAIEDTTVIVLANKDFDLLVEEFPEIKEIFFHIAMTRFTHYARLFRSYISHKPKERYLELLRTDPRIIERVPQHYIYADWIDLFGQSGSIERSIRRRHSAKRALSAVNPERYIATDGNLISAGL